MYRVLLFSAFLALSIGAPYSDVNWQQPSLPVQDQKLVQQPIQMTRDQQPDETEIVDSLGGGYSYFKKQPIVARPVMQQKLALQEQPTSISSFDDTPNQWSDYTKASAFKEQPKSRFMHHHHHHHHTQNDLLMKDQETYGTSLVEEQKSQPIPIDIQDKSSISLPDNTYGQQEIRTIIPQQPILTPKSNDAYGQQDIRTLVQQQPLVRTAPTSYGQQDLTPIVAPKSNDAYGQQEIRTIVPQQPLPRTVPSSYGQQDLKQIVTPKSNDAYGQQEIRTIIPQQPLPRTVPSSYGQQNIRTLVPQQPLTRNFASPYGQQDIRTLVQPLTRNFASSYGQQDTRTIIPQQPLVRTVPSTYGQQDIRTLVQQQPLIRNFASSYGQQDLQQPLTVKSNSGYGQSFEDKLSIPRVNTADDVQLTQPSWSAQQSLPIKKSFGGW